MRNRHFGKLLYEEIQPQSAKSAKSATLESSFDERIHWFRVEGRSICVKILIRFQKYSDSFG